MSDETGLCDGAVGIVEKEERLRRDEERAIGHAFRGPAAGISEEQARKREEEAARRAAMMAKIEARKTAAAEEELKRTGHVPAIMLRQEAHAADITRTLE